MYSVWEIKSFLRTHSHFEQFQQAGLASIRAEEFAFLLPHVNGANAVRRYVEREQTFLQQVYKSDRRPCVFIKYNRGYYCKHERRRIKPWLSIES